VTPKSRYTPETLYTCTWCIAFTVSCLECKVWGLGFRVQGLEFGVESLGVYGLGIMVYGLSFEVPGFRGQVSGFRVQGLGFRVHVSEFGIPVASQSFCLVAQPSKSAAPRHKIEGGTSQRKSGTSLNLRSSDFGIVVDQVWVSRSKTISSFRTLHFSSGILRYVQFSTGIQQFTSGI